MAILDELERLAHELGPPRYSPYEIWVSSAAPPGDDTIIGYQLDCAAAGIVPLNPTSERIVLLDPVTVLRLEAQGVLPIPGVSIYEPATACQSIFYRIRVARHDAQQARGRGDDTLADLYEELARTMKAEVDGTIKRTIKEPPDG